MKRMLTFDDVQLQPYYNNVESREEPSLITNITKNTVVHTPLIASSMESVIGQELADVLLKKGSMPIYHRYDSPENIADWIEANDGETFISWGVNDLGDLLNLVSGYPPLGVCLDVAHGHSIKMERAIKTLKDAYPDLEIIAGAVCTKLGVNDFAAWGADAVRVGIGPGAACTTREVTGFGTPQFSALLECGTVAKRRKIPMIADGGIRNSGDIVKALAAGASTVMLGKLFAATTESAAEKKMTNMKFIGPPAGAVIGDSIARYRGQASEYFQREGLKPEGEEGWLTVTGSAVDLMDGLEAGIKSGLTYGGARTIAELQEHATFVEVTATFQQEKGTRLL